MVQFHATERLPESYCYVAAVCWKFAALSARTAILIANSFLVSAVGVGSNDWQNAGHASSGTTIGAWPYMQVPYRQIYIASMAKNTLSYDKMALQTT